MRKIKDILRLKHEARLSHARIADAILDRLMQHHHRFTLTGESLRQNPRAPRKETAERSS